MMPTEEEMKERIVSFIKELREKGNKLEEYEETDTIQEIVLPLLARLGWNRDNKDEVKQQYRVDESRGSSTKVDFALRIKSANKVFIEVKRVKEQLQNHEDQLRDYVAVETVPFAILTNGKDWWFYLPSKEGRWKEKKFYMLDIINEPPDEVTSKFIDFLSKENIATDRAKELAEEIYEQQKKKKEIERVLPEVWNEIITEQNEELVKLLAMAVKNRCGHEEPDNKTIREILLRNRLRLVLPTREEEKESASTVATEKSYSEEKEFCSIYKEYWKSKLDDIAKIIREALQYGKSEEIFVSEIVYISKEKGPKKGEGRKMKYWDKMYKIQCRSGEILISEQGGSHMICLGRVLKKSLPQKYPDILQKCFGKTLVFHCKPVGNEENFSVKLWVEVKQ